MIVKVFTLARVAKLADARDLKSRVPKGTYRFDSGPGHHGEVSVRSLGYARDFGCGLPLRSRPQYAST